jgi:hypothetical protein
MLWSNAAWCNHVVAVHSDSITMTAMQLDGTAGATSKQCVACASIYLAALLLLLWHMNHPASLGNCQESHRSRHAEPYMQCGNAVHLQQQHPQLKAQQSPTIWQS